MSACPSCQLPLTKQRASIGVVYGCPRCGGRAAALPVLRNAGAPASLLRELWSASVQAARVTRRCPHCNKTMAQVTTPVGGHSLTLDVCRRCAAVWFDRGEFQAVPLAPPAPADPLSSRARERLALAKVEDLQRRGETDADEGGPPDAWQWLPGLFGLPVEFDAPPLAARPWLTWGIGAAMVAVFAATAWDLEPAVREWGFVPAQWTRHVGLTLVTAFFLHASVFHLVSNLYFFAIFGDNVEDDLGRWAFVALLAGAHIAGAVAHALWDPRCSVPCVGASAGISGILGYYAVAFPRVRLGFLWWLGLLFGWIRMPVVVALGLFLLVQIIGAWQEMSGFGGVSYLAHLAGLLVGIATAVVVRMSRSEATQRVLSRR